MWRSERLEVCITGLGIKPIRYSRDGFSVGTGGDNADDAEYLKNKGFTVEGEAPADPDPLAGMTAKELTSYATDHGIDLTGVPNSKGKILAAIRAVEPLPTEEE